MDAMGDIAADPPQGARLTDDERDALVVEVVRLHADGLLRLARRHSLCAEDAQDAYQRGLEIMLRHAHRLDPERAPSWLRTVVKHEAMAVRRTRQRELAPADLDFDRLEASTTPSPDEQAASFETVARSAEALQRLKPQEVRALWLQAQGNSYEEIGELTGWSRTKVNRCIYEGRRSFLERYAGIASGAECERWQPLLSRLVDGEATHEELVELRPHLRACSACRGVVRELHRASTPLAIVLPLGAFADVQGSLEPAGQLFVKVFDTATTWLGERAASSFVRAQLAVEAVVRVGREAHRGRGGVGGRRRWRGRGAGPCRAAGARRDRGGRTARARRRARGRPRQPATPDDRGAGGSPRGRGPAQAGAPGGAGAQPDRRSPGIRRWRHGHSGCHEHRCDDDHRIAARPPPRPLRRRLRRSASAELGLE